MSVKPRRNDVTTEIVVGAFMFVMLVVLLTMSLVISQNKFFERTYTMDVTFADIGGVKTGEPVFLRGVRIGNVNDITVPASGRGVNLRLRLQRPVELHEDYRFIIEPSSMLGGMRLVIEEGSEGSRLLEPEEYASLKGQPVTDLISEATRTLELIRNTLVEGGVLADIQSFTSNLREISDKVNEGQGTLARLINEDALYNEATGSLANINTITTRLAQGEGAIGKLLSGEDSLVDDLQATLANLREFTGSLNAQEGTLGLLITQDGLYRKVESLVDEARATLDDFRETSPITTFSSIFFGAF